LPVVDRFVSYKTGPALTAGEPGAVIRRDREGTIELVNLVWGFQPRQPDERPVTLLRSEGRQFDTRRCLIPASEFTVRAGPGKASGKWRVTMVGDDFFYFAGIWRPEQNGWPPSYAILTIEANPDVAPHYHRQNAVIRREDRMNWLDGLKSDTELLRPLPGRSFRLEQVRGQSAFNF
jgi:putative SOS response-associated peptidase YedK